MKRLICAKHKVMKKSGFCPIDKRCTKFIIVNEELYKMYSNNI